MKRIAQLDGVRGVAILLVIIWHYFVCQVGAEPGSMLGSVTRSLILTWSGVDLFFVLSGFLIAGILIDQRHTSNYFRVFYIRRICRIFPLYFLLLGLFICLTATPLFASPAYRWLFHDPFPIWSYASFIQNVFMGIRGDFGPNWLGITWSLAVEEQFYLLIPLGIYFLSRRALACVFLAAIFMAPILRLIYPGFHAIVNTPWRSDALLLGALLALLVRWDSFMSVVRRRKNSLLLLLGLLSIGVAFMTLQPGAFEAVIHLWLAVLYATLVLVAFLGVEPWLQCLLTFRPLVMLGQLSYGIYMFHQAVSGLLHGVIRQATPQILSLADAGVTLLSLCVTLILAALSFYFLEGPVLRYGRRFQYQPEVPREMKAQSGPASA